MIHTFSSGGFHTHSKTLSHPMSKREYNLKLHSHFNYIHYFFIIIFFLI